MRLSIIFAFQCKFILLCASTLSAIDIVEAVPEKQEEQAEEAQENTESQKTEDPGFSCAEAFLFLNVLSDFVTLSSSTIFLTSANHVGTIPLFEIAAGIRSSSLGFDFFRDYEAKIKLIKKECLNFLRMCLIVDGIGHWICFAGLIFLATGINKEAGLWVFFGGYLIKCCTLAVKILHKGIDGTFRNDRTIENFVFKLVLLTGGCGMGVFIAALGAHMGEELTLKIGVNAFSVCSLLGASNQKYRDLELLYKKLNYLREAKDPCGES